MNITEMKNQIIQELNSYIKSCRIKHHVKRAENLRYFINNAHYFLQLEYFIFNEVLLMKFGSCYSAFKDVALMMEKYTIVVNLINRYCQTNDKQFLDAYLTSINKSDLENGDCYKYYLGLLSNRIEHRQNKKPSDSTWALTLDRILAIIYSNLVLNSELPALNYTRYENSYKNQFYKNNLNNDISGISLQPQDQFKTSLLQNKPLLQPQSMNYYQSNVSWHKQIDDLMRLIIINSLLYHKVPFIRTIKTTEINVEINKKHLDKKTEPLTLQLPNNKKKIIECQNNTFDYYQQELGKTENWTETLREGEFIMDGLILNRFMFNLFEFKKLLEKNKSEFFNNLARAIFVFSFYKHLSDTSIDKMLATLEILPKMTSFPVWYIKRMRWLAPKPDNNGQGCQSGEYFCMDTYEKNGLPSINILDESLLDESMHWGHVGDYKPERLTWKKYNYDTWISGRWLVIDNIDENANRKWYLEKGKSKFVANYSRKTPITQIKNTNRHEKNQAFKTVLNTLENPCFRKRTKK